MPAAHGAVPLLWVVLVSAWLGIALLIALGISVVQRRSKTLERHTGRAELLPVPGAAQDAPLVLLEVADGGLRVADASPGAGRLFGVLRSEVMGQPVAHLLTGHDSDTLCSALYEAAVTRRPAVTEAALARRSGALFSAVIAAYPVDTGRPAPALIAVVVDMTEHVRSEEQRRKAVLQAQHTEKLKSLETMAGGIAHDFNNLLVGVLGNADLAMMDISPLSPARPCVEAIKSAAVRATELTRQMLTYAGRARFRVEVVDLNATIRGIGQLLKASVVPCAALCYELDEEIPAIEADVSQLRQLLVSLVTNASDALGESPGSVTIRTRRIHADRQLLAETYLDDNLPEGDYVSLDIEDTGCGMDQTVLPRLFDPFFSTKSPGRGLGLATVLAIVRGHKGAIGVSSAPARGTRFQVLLPATRRAPVRTGEPGSPSSGLPPSGTVLVVDDEETVRRVTDAMLSRFGFNVLTASSGQQGVETFRHHAHTVKAVLLNVTMPGMNGPETLRALREIQPRARVIVCSGLGEDEARARFAGEPLAGFIQKPFEMDRLLGVLREAITDG